MDSKISKWKVIGLDSKQSSHIRELHRSQAKGIICKKYRKQYLKIVRELREDYIKERLKEIEEDQNDIYR